MEEVFFFHFLSYKFIIKIFKKYKIYDIVKIEVVCRQVVIIF
jgi:hypothetical protein